MSKDKQAVYIVNGSAAYASLFKKLGYYVSESVEEADFLCFTGGADVSANIYGDKQHARTGNDVGRDAQEMEVFHKALAADKPMVGICRGGQFLNVMSGGRMYQHVEKHAIYGTHEIIDVESGEHYQVTSTHHQMFMPSDKAEIVAIATLGGSREWYDGQVFKRDESNTDYEVLYYPHTKSLCFQPHPEFNGEGYDGMRNYFSHLLNVKLGLEHVSA